MGNFMNTINNVIQNHAEPERKQNNQNLRYINHLNTAECPHTINNCPNLKRMKPIIVGGYNSKMNDVDIDGIMSCFIQLLLAHNETDDFQFIYDSLSVHCKLKECTYLRIDPKEMRLMDASEVAKIQILSKIHCYFMHSFDFGLRLSAKDQETMRLHLNSQSTDETEPENMFKLAEENIFANKLLSGRHISYRSARSRGSPYYNRFMTDINDNEEKQIMNDNELYHFGYQYVYEADRHSNDLYEDLEYSNYIGYVKPVHKSLKDEVTMNKFCVINKWIFDSEFKKAEVHLRTWYAKKIQSDSTDKMKFTIQHILAVMLYCNFDAFSYEFSKSYRSNRTSTSADWKEAIARHHAEFCNMGMLLDEMVNVFEYPNKVETFFHGINKTLNFPLEGHWNNIYIPLSTSSSFEIATNFASEGVIIVFHGDCFEPAKYLQCDWLSDFIAEKECLFIQTGNALRFNNIIDVAFCFEYDHILRAIIILSRLTYADFLGEYLETLIVRLIQNELKIALFHSLTPYAANLFHQFCVRRKMMNIDWEKVTTKYSFLFDVFCLRQYQWINLGNLCKLFPNISTFEVVKICISDEVFVNIIKYLEGNNKTSLEEIVIAFVHKVDRKEITEQYAMKLGKINWRIDIEDEFVFIHKENVNYHNKDEFGHHSRIETIITKLRIERSMNNIVTQFKNDKDLQDHMQYIK